MSARLNYDSPLVRWGPAVILMVVIFGFSSVPSDDMPHFGEMDFIVKKLGHMVGYALLSLAFAWGIGIQKPGAIWKAWLLTVAYAAADEFHQSFVPGRNASLMDVGIDALGAFIGLIPVVAFRKLSSLPEKHPG